MHRMYIHIKFHIKDFILSLAGSFDTIYFFIIVHGIDCYRNRYQWLFCNAKIVTRYIYLVNIDRYRFYLVSNLFLQKDYKPYGDVIL